MQGTPAWVLGQLVSSLLPFLQSQEDSGSDGSRRSPRHPPPPSRPNFSRFHAVFLRSLQHVCPPSLNEKSWIHFWVDAVLLQYELNFNVSFFNPPPTTPPPTTPPPTLQLTPRAANVRDPPLINGSFSMTLIG